MGLNSGTFALLGAPPAFEQPLHVGRPNIGDRDSLMRRVERLLDEARLTNDGPLVMEFEAAVAELVGVRHCVTTCNATTGLQLLVRALGLGGEVIVSPFTFVASAHALLWQGVTPVFCDVDPDTHNLDPDRVEAAITPRTSGILGVHLWGRPCAVEELTAIADRRALRLLFDAAHGFGCSSGGRMVGSFGVAEVFSFHATKVVNSFEGGAIVTDDDGLADELRLLRNFGFADYDEVVALGTNAKLTEVAAAMALTSLESRDAFFAANARNHDAYRSGLAQLEAVEVLAYDDGELANRQYVVVEIDESAALSRDELQQVLWAENVLARRYFYPGCHRMEPYRTLFPDVSLPQAERLADRVLVLPTGATMTVEAVGQVVHIIRRALADGPRLKEALRATRS